MLIVFARSICSWCGKYDVCKLCEIYSASAAFQFLIGSMRQDQAGLWRPHKSVSIPYRFNETTSGSPNLTRGIYVSIPYRFNETEHININWLLTGEFQFLIGSMRPAMQGIPCPA